MLFLANQNAQIVAHYRGVALSIVGTGDNLEHHFLRTSKLLFILC